MASKQQKLGDTKLNEKEGFSKLAVKFTKRYFSFSESSTTHIRAKTTLTLLDNIQNKALKAIGDHSTN